MLAQLPAIERQWLSHMIPEARVRRLAARVALRRLLSRRLGLPADALRFQFGPWGKPSIHPLHGSRIVFNVSHAGDWVLIALGDAGDLGVDVEMVTDTTDHDMLAEQILSPCELSWYRKLPVCERRLGFYRAWVRKEAVLKAVGLGLSLEPQSFEVSGDSGWHRLISLPGASGDDLVEVHAVEAPTGYVAAFARRPAVAGDRAKSPLSSHHPIY